MSMGMRARLVTPTTAMNRQMTTMSYGLRMANLDIGVDSLVDVYRVLAPMAVTRGRTFLTRLQGSAPAQHHTVAFVETGKDLDII